ncbi:MAG: phosphotransferase family protein, partial [Alphaproteobacteria bacterium]|nr:phosphotransferase family protein [Alphaproteobacteria bacterium]
MSDGIIGEVVPALRFDEAKLKAHLEKNIEGFGSDLRVQQIKGGASNPTYKLTTQGPDGPLSYVLRKKPPGQLLASAHQVDREYRVMKALQDTGVPVPRMRWLEQDDSIIGTPFYVMDFLEGRIFRDARLPGLTPKERAAVYDELNATLAKLHQVDYQAVGLSDFGRPSGYFERQVARWTKQYRGAESEHIPAMEKLIEVLPTMIPADQSVSIAHGDYRLENTMFHPTEPRLIAVLDWELCTIGHPLADIGYNGFMWHSHGESWGTLDGVDFATSGIPTEAEYRDAYCRRTGRDHIENWNFYVAFGVFRLASIGQGVYRRALAG